MAVYPGGANTFVPSFEATGQLQIEYSRNPASFALNKYTGFKSVDKITGYYLSITPAEAARVVKEQDYAWPDAQDAPEGHDGTESFTFSQYFCNRFAYAYNNGDFAVQQAAWDVLASHGRIMAQKAMTARTMRALDVLTTAGNWSGNTGTATALGGGLWSASDATNQYILKTINAVKENVHKATLGAVPPDAIRMVVNPVLAHTIRENPEIINFIQQNQQAFPALAGSYFFQRWGLPEMLYGVKVVVEDTVKVTTRKNTATTGYALGNTVAIFTAVTEGLENSKEPADGAPTFNTMTIFAHEDMTVESKRDDDNRRTKARVVDNTDEVLTAPASGYYVTGCA